MSKTYERPTVTREEGGHREGANTYDHPAFGTIALFEARGGNEQLFGSDVPHSSCLRIEIRRAELRRDLNRDWIHSREVVCEFEMTHAQFAQFITGVGNGTGTPVTLLRAPERGAKLGTMPGIEKIESKHDTHRREVREAATKQVDRMHASIGKLDELLASGKAGKKDLQAIARELRIAAEHLPVNLEFAVKSAEEALEKATSDAKIEVEAFVGMTAQRLGLQNIQQLAQLERDEKQP
jgi:hypothetical protein